MNNRYAYLLDVDTGVLVTQRVLVSQLSNNGDRVQTSVLGERGRDDLQRLGEGLETVGLFTLEGLSVLCQQSGDVDLRCASSSDESSANQRGGSFGRVSIDLPLLHQTSHDTQRIVQTSLALLQDQSVRTGADHADSLSRVLNSSHLDDLGSTLRRLLDQLCVTELVLGERLNVGNGLAACRSRDEVDLVSLDVLDDHDLQLGEEMEGEVGDSVSKN
jgi:hypothetical protein